MYLHDKKALAHYLVKNFIHFKYFKLSLKDMIDEPLFARKKIMFNSCLKTIKGYIHMGSPMCPDVHSGSFIIQQSCICT